MCLRQPHRLRDCGRICVKIEDPCNTGCVRVVVQEIDSTSQYLLCVALTGAATRPKHRETRIRDPDEGAATIEQHN